MLSLLRKWLDRRSVECDVLFTTRDGNPVKGRALRAMIKRRARKAGITKDVHPYTLRHSFAIKMYRHTKDLQRVQQMLGHAALSTTMIYADLVDPEVEEAMKYFNLE